MLEPNKKFRVEIRIRQPGFQGLLSAAGGEEHSPGGRYHGRRGEEPPGRFPGQFKGPNGLKMDF